MRKMYFVSIILSCYSLIATADQANYCTYGRSGDGPAYFNFTKVEIPNNPMRGLYRAILSENLIVTVEKYQLYRADYTMTADYNRGQFSFGDYYSDFYPHRLLTISGVMDEKDLHCEFDPSF